MKDDLKKSVVVKIGQWKWPLIVLGTIPLNVFFYFAQSGYPLYRANRTPGRAWSAWDAADHNVDGNLTSNEMEKFGKQKPHRNVEQLLKNFDAADTDHDGTVTQIEIDIYGTDIGSKDRENRRDER